MAKDTKIVIECPICGEKMKETLVQPNPYGIGRLAVYSCNNPECICFGVGTADMWERVSEAIQGFKSFETKGVVTQAQAQYYLKKVTMDEKQPVS